MKSLDDLNHEIFAGVDEVGRGCLAGAVLACAVVLDPAVPIAGLRDSKALSPARREALDIEIREKALAWAIGRAEVDEIDRINILQATLVAMQRAVRALPMRVEHVIVDGNHAPDLECRVECLIKGDSLLDAIMAASIVAKVTRDREMVELAARYPGYDLASNKGYGTRVHLQAIEDLGPEVIHRRSFAPMRYLDNPLPGDRGHSQGTSE